MRVFAIAPSALVATGIHTYPQKSFQHWRDRYRNGAAHEHDRAAFRKAASYK
jgi:hypothetical protein